MILQLLVNNPSAIFSYCDKQCPVILLQNGVYSANTLVKKYPNNVYYALENDWLASGLPPCSLVTLISSSDWVNLCALHHPVITIQE
jgi:sulfur transfer complex TusBCD TusB component (DsrH family)